MSASDGRTDGNGGDPRRGPRETAGVVAPPPVIFSVPLLLGLLANRRLGLGFVPEGLRKPVGFPLLAGGLGLGLWFFREMRAADTPVDPYRPVSRLVTSGPFRYTRNPAYLALLANYLGVSVLKNSLPPLLLLPLVLYAMNRGVVEREEAYLREKFGEEYESYLAEVPRWL